MSVARTLTYSTVPGLRSKLSEGGTTQLAMTNHLLRLRSSSRAGKINLEGRRNTLHLSTALRDAVQA